MGLCRWLEVGEEVLEAARAGLPGLSEQEVQAQLCFALLCSARFNLAKTYLTGMHFELARGAGRGGKGGAWSPALQSAQQHTVERQLSERGPPGGFWGGWGMLGQLQSAT